MAQVSFLFRLKKTTGDLTFHDVRDRALLETYGRPAGCDRDEAVRFFNKGTLEYGLLLDFCQKLVSFIS